MNDGWLCDSILKTAARPSPMSTAPAFSPGPCTTREPSVGSVRRCFLLLLYEQCSDHMTEKSPSSVRLGSRPRAFTIRSYSSRVRLCWARASGLTGIPNSIRQATGAPGRSSRAGARAALADSAHESGSPNALSASGFRSVGLCRPPDPEGRCRLLPQEVFPEPSGCEPHQPRLQAFTGIVQHRLRATTLRPAAARGGSLPPGAKLWNERWRGDGPSEVGDRHAAAPRLGSPDA